MASNGFYLHAALLLSMSVISYGFKNCEENTLQLCHCEEKSSDLFIVDCSNVGLTSTPKCIPTKTTHLYLDNNFIKILENGSFLEGLPNLVKLSIRNNTLKQIQPTAFYGLKSLEYLNLYNNQLQYMDSLSPTVFQPLNQSLKVLDIRMNLLNDNLDLLNYPLSVAKLYNLNELRMDLLRAKPLPEEYEALCNLQKLLFQGGRQNVGHVQNNTFDAVSTLDITEINLCGLDITIIRMGTFSNLKNLDTLDVSNNPGLRFSIREFASSIRNTSITRLRMNNTGIGNSGIEAAEIIRGFCLLGLKELTMDKNFIHSIDPVFKECLPTLERLSLGDNYLSIRYSFVYDTIFVLTNLHGYNISAQRRATSQKGHDYSGNFVFQSLQDTKRTVAINGRNYSRICQEGMTCPVYLPSNIQWIDISQNGFVLTVVPQVALLNNNSLNFINMSYNGIHNARLPVYCPNNVIPQIETFDVSNNGIQCFNATFFNMSITGCDWSSLKRFYLGNNEIGRIDKNSCNKDKHDVLGFLKPLWNLRVLDLSMNYFNSKNSLSDLQNLTMLHTLDLSFNGFDNFTLGLKNLKRISKLNIANNNLKCLSESTVLQLNRLQNHRQKPIKIDLSENLLSCNCACFYFFQWMTKTDVVLVNNKTYQCVFDDGKKETLNHISSIVAELESKCYGTEWLNIYVGMEVLVYIFITIFCFMYRIRHDIWYIYLKIKLSRQRLKALLDQKNYTYTAFISCDHRDAKYFVKRRLLPNLETNETKFKFCVSQRDFIVGATIIDNIMRSMEKSKRIIFIISQYFLTSNWCKEEIRIAHQVCSIHLYYFLKMFDVFHV